MTDRINALVGAELRRRRIAVGMSQASLGEKLELSRTSITNIERGRQAMSVHHLYLAAEALGIHPRDLLPDSPTSGTRAGRSARNVSKLLELLTSPSASA